MRLLNQGHTFAHVPELTEPQFKLLQRWCRRPEKNFVSSWFSVHGREAQSAAKLFEYGLLVSYRSVTRTRKFHTLKKGKIVEIPGDLFVTIYYRPLDWVVNEINSGSFPLVKGIAHIAAIQEKPKYRTAGKSLGTVMIEELETR